MAHTILIDTQLPDEMLAMMGPGCDVRIWSDGDPGLEPLLQAATGMLTYGHPLVDGPLMDRIPNLKVISNFGVGVDHIDLAAARQRGIPVGNTPHILDGATADMTFTLLL